MAPEIISTLKFNHFVAIGEDTLFASARDPGNKIYNFLVYRNGTVKEQINSHFEPLYRKIAEEVRAVIESCYSRVPTYKIDTAKINCEHGRAGYSGSEYSLGKII